MSNAPATEAIVVRVPRKSVQRLDKAARARGITRSQFVRELLETSLAESIDLAEEARRQSLLVSRLESEREAMEFLQAATSTDGWE